MLHNNRHLLSHRIKRNMINYFKLKHISINLNVFILLSGFQQTNLIFLEKSKDW